ncbi:MAG TPA: tRNA epoxyqueuosine(34) reductase QueG [Lacipirellulaceae bacterium]|nr:tRNA epoxyqueuosine(34) reductase QueG [Lacipirellulaceae bacterium]
MSTAELTAALRRRAFELGFTLVGVCPAVAPAGVNRLAEWLARGYAGDMHYFAQRQAAYAHPGHVLDGVRSIIMLGLPYDSGPSQPLEPGQGRVARYAWGPLDYHDAIRQRLHKLADRLRELAPAAATRGVVDTAPLLEREFAQLAGLGWVGKNTLLLNRHAGSYFFLGALLTDALLEIDAPHDADHCGTCTACLESCPTQAFPQPYVLDASRCISYLTIEHRGEISPELRPGMGDWLFGCDICQQVCPWNHHAAKGAARTGEPPMVATIAPAVPADAPPLKPLEHDASDAGRRAATPPALELIPLFALSEAEFRARFRHTPLWRPHRRGLLRNAAIVLGNQRSAAAIPALTRGLCDPEPLVREACAWSLEQITGEPTPSRPPDSGQGSPSLAALHPAPAGA